MFNIENIIGDLKWYNKLHYTDESCRSNNFHMRNVLLEILFCKSNKIIRKINFDITRRMNMYG